MKNSLSFVCFLFVFQLSALAAVLTVDNNPGSVAQYTSLANAIADAADNDTILIAGSGSHYGSHEIYKPLHFVGYGFFLGANSVPGLSTRLSDVDLTFKQHGAIGDSSGSSVTGLSGIIDTDAGANNITIDRCYGNGHNWTFNGTVTITSVFHINTLTVRAADSTVRNSIFWTLHLEASNLSAINCVVRGQINAVPSNSFTNCIFSITSAGNWDNDATFSHCINIGASLLPGGNNNINGEVFSTVVTQTGGNEGLDRFWVLKEGSVAAGVGLGGEDIGAFGGADPYVLGGVPGIPRITRFDVPPTATGLSTFTFEIESQAFAE